MRPYTGLRKVNHTCYVVLATLLAQWLSSRVGSKGLLKRIWAPCYAPGIVPFLSMRLWCAWGLCLSTMRLWCRGYPFSQNLDGLGSADRGLCTAVRKIPEPPCIVHFS